MLKLILITFFLIIHSSPSFAYLGPGIGGGIIAATLGIIIAILAALFGLIWFPIKKLIKKNKENQIKKSKKID